MKNNWSLYVAGVGGLDAAQDMLTNFVSQLRDLGLKITQVQVIEGLLHPDLGAVDETEDNGWTMYAYGSGDVSKAYETFPTFLQQFEQNGIKVLHNGIVEGALREIPIPA